MTSLKTTLGVLTLAAGLFGGSSAVQAMPVAVFDPAATVQTADLSGPDSQDLLMQVRDGCGPGWHANPWGRCAPNRWRPRPVDRRYGYYVRPWHRPAYGFYDPRPWHRPWIYR